MRVLILILLLPCLALAGTTTVTHTSIIDTYIAENGGAGSGATKQLSDSLNYGNQTSLRLRGDDTGWVRILLADEELSQYSNRGLVLDYKLWLHVSEFFFGGDVGIGQLFKPFREGSGTGSGHSYAHHIVSGGATWKHYWSPVPLGFSSTVSNLPSSFDWRDSLAVPKAPWQSGCGACWVFAVVAAVISDLQRKYFPNGTGAGPNVLDSAGADRCGMPEAQGSNDNDVAINLPNTYHAVRLTKASTNIWDTLSFAIQRYADDTGDFVIDADEIEFVVVYRDLEVDPVHCYYDTLRISASEVEATCLSSDDSTLGMGGSQYFYVNDDFPVLLVRAPDLSTSLDSTGSITTLGIMTDDDGGVYTSLRLKTIGVNTTSQVAAYACLKVWETDAYDSATAADSGTTFNRFDVAGDKQWGQTGARRVDQYDLSEQQLIDCVGDGDGCTGGYSYEALEYLLTDSIANEESYLYTGVDTDTCFDLSGSDLVTNLGWWWRIPINSRDSLKAAIITTGPIMVRIQCNYGPGDPPAYFYIDDDSCYTHTGDPTGLHEVIIVGWDDDKDCFDSTADTTGAWLIRDSKGESFGDNGCAWIGYNTINLGSAYASELDSFPRRWSTMGANCGGSAHPAHPWSCDTENMSSTPACHDTSCDRHYIGDGYMDTVTVTDTGWVSFDLSTTLLQDRIDGTFSEYGFILQSLDDSVNIVFNSTENSTYKPYFEIRFSTQSFVGKGVIGKCILGN